MKVAIVVGWKYKIQSNSVGEEEKGDFSKESIERGRDSHLSIIICHYIDHTDHKYWINC